MIFIVFLGLNISQETDTVVDDLPVMIANPWIRTDRLEQGERKMKSKEIKDQFRFRERHNMEF